MPLETFLSGFLKKNTWQVIGRIIRLSPSITGSLQPIRTRVRELNQLLIQTLTAVGRERSENTFLSRKAFSVVFEPAVASRCRHV